MCDAPVLFLIFNRPDTTRQVFDAIKKARPGKLYIAADGPRGNVPEDAERCRLARRVTDQIDWNCEVQTLFRDVNLGCKRAVSSAIDWFFSRVEEGIVLEDDCMPDPTFFPFCDELLARHRSDTRVMQICGSNFLQGWKRTDHSYYFSLYGPVWGWASWSRAWQYYDVDMKLWPGIENSGVFRDFCLDDEEANFRRDLYERLYAGEINTWDYQWGFAKMINSGLSITPNVNLITNIGGGADATHTSTSSADRFMGMTTDAMPFPLKHPLYMLRDRVSDRRFMDEFVLRKNR